MRTALLCTIFALSYGLTTIQAQSGPPPIIRIYVEQVKPGKGPAHQRAEAAFARAFAKASFPSHYIALDAMSGSSECWFVEAHNSFAEVEKSEKASDAEPLKSELEQAGATDGEYLSGTRSMIGVYRADLSYDPEGATPLPKTHYFNVATIRIKMAAEQRMAAAVGELTKIYKNVAMPQATLVYQIISGTQSGTYMLFEPLASLAEWDKWPSIMKSIRDTAARKFDSVEKEFADISTFEESRLMSVNPRTSYVSKETIAGDPAFWSPRPKTDPAPAAKKSAAVKKSAP